MTESRDSGWARKIKPPPPPPPPPSPLAQSLDPSMVPSFLRAALESAAHPFESRFPREETKVWKKIN